MPYIFYIVYSQPIANKILGHGHQFAKYVHSVQCICISVIYRYIYHNISCIRHTIHFIHIIFMQNYKSNETKKRKTVPFNKLICKNDVL